MPDSPDQWIACPSCWGLGRTEVPFGATECVPCHGTGEITRRKLSERVSFPIGGLEDFDGMLDRELARLKGTTGR